MFYLNAYAAKAQHPLVAGTKPNADMTAHCAQWAVVLDGVGGVPWPFRPEDLSWDLRNALRFNMRNRFDRFQSKNQYDKDVIAEIQGSVALMSHDPPGAWMARLLHMSIGHTTCFGSTTVGIVSLKGSKVTYCHVGDVSISIHRFAENLRIASVVFQSRDHHVAIRTAGGHAVGPKQISIYTEDDRLPASISRSVGQADYGTIPVRIGDVVLVHSDGITDNIRHNTMKNLMTDFFTRGDTPQRLVATLINHAQSPTAAKPDDISVFAGIVTAF